MKGLYLLFQRSIAIKVVTSTLLLSLGVIWLTGSALNSRLSDGIRSVNLNSSLAEARLALFNAQYQFVITQVATPEQREIVLAQIVKEATTQGAKQLQREVIILKSPLNKAESELFEIASNQSRKDSVPPALRERVIESAEIAYEYGETHL
jgi:two-component system, OmpR family, sensor histidine kinase MtrB